MPEDIVVGFGWAIILTFFGGCGTLALIIATASFVKAREWIRSRTWWK